MCALHLLPLCQTVCLSMCLQHSCCTCVLMLLLPRSCWFSSSNVPASLLVFGALLLGMCVIAVVKGLSAWFITLVNICKVHSCFVIWTPVTTPEQSRCVLCSFCVSVLTENLDTKAAEYHHVLSQGVAPRQRGVCMQHQHTLLSALLIYRTVLNVLTVYS